MGSEKLTRMGTWTLCGSEAQASRPLPALPLSTLLTSVFFLLPVQYNVARTATAHSERKELPRRSGSASALDLVDRVLRLQSPRPPSRWIRPMFFFSQSHLFLLSPPLPSSFLFSFPSLVSRSRTMLIDTKAVTLLYSFSPFLYTYTSSIHSPPPAPLGSPYYANCANREGSIGCGRY